ncbi:natural killer cell receptor 2B4-like [Triplophysa dalaica]|uniref:natural killer cell receptor 2B4-like n=1 Tax=Triplophysa dalaica TaxID=1582913 RepID=UPI0024DF3423|nr:natural killer cell receptor 2B4-like [Triplophysa dalaica]
MLKGMYSMFVLFCLVSWCLVGTFGDDTDEVISVSVMEGENITLYTDLSELQRDDLILWSFGDKGTQIAELNRSAKNITLSKNNGRFINRLKLNQQTGSLVITNIKTTDSGLYKAQIIGNKVSKKTFNVIVIAHLPVPVIVSYCPQNPPSSERSSVSKCVLLCSVMNVSHVSLSWYKGNSLLSSISVSDLNIRLSLPLEVEYQDTNTYRCVINNPITNHTQHLNITQLCQPCSGDCVDNYDTSEALIRLVVSALMGMAAVAASVVLIYDIKSRRAEENKKDQTSVKQ